MFFYFFNLALKFVQKNKKTKPRDVMATEEEEEEEVEEAKDCDIIWEKTLLQ